MTSSAPLLNRYKRPFVKHRFVQTVFGGTKLYLPEKGPLYVYILQIIILFFPAFIGIPFVVITQYDIIGWDIACYSGGAIFGFVVLMWQTISTILQTKNSAVQPNTTTTAERSFDEFTEVEFNGCCSSTTAGFILPQKQYKVNIVLHSLFAGVVLGLSIWFLRINVLNDLFGSIATSVFISAFSWLSVCFGLYSLTASVPEELAIYRTPDVFESQALTRSFHILVLIIIHILYSYLSGFVLANQIVHGIFASLPLFWMFGILPHVEPLLLWAFEQILIHAFGGSSMLSGLRILLMLISSVAVYLAIFFFSNPLVRIVLMSLFGYLLAIDLGGVGARISEACCMSNLQRERKIVLSGFLWRWHVFEVLFHCIMCAVSTGLGTGMHLLLENSTLERTMNENFGFASIGFFSLDVILCELQKVYIMFGLLRNPLFPKCIQSIKEFERRKRILQIMGYCRRISINYVSPCVLLVYVTTSVNLSGTWIALLAETRAFRSVWQHTEFTLFDVTIQFSVSRLLAGTPESGWLQLGTGLQLLIIALIRSRSTELAHKLYAYLVILVTSYSYRRQRHKHATVVLLLNIIFFPLVLTFTLLVATGLSAPVLPLFTLPVMFIGFPRPMKFWSTAVGASENKCEDTIFYRQVTPALVKSLRSAFSNGTLCWSVGGSFFMARFHDRLVWITVLERGYAFYTINVKGLELQVTSCHSTEVTKIDGMVEKAFDNGGPKVLAYNRNLGHVWTLKDTLQFTTYSDAKNQLVGIIDSPDFLKFFPSTLLKCLIWNIVRHLQISSSTVISRMQSGKNADAKCDERNVTEIFENPLLRRPTLESQQKVPLRRMEIDDDMSLGSNWSDSEAGSHYGITNTINAPTTGRDVLLENKADVLPPIESTITKLPPLRLPPPFLGDDDLGLAGFDGIGLSPTRPSPKFNFDLGRGDVKFGDVTRIPGNWQELPEATQFLRLENGWLQVPIKSSAVQTASKLFPLDWFHRTVRHFSDQTMDGATLTGSQVDDCYSKFVVALAMIILDDNPDLVAESPRRIFNAYVEKMSWHKRTSWLTEYPVLKSLVVRSVRYAVKVCLDELILGTIDSMDELGDLLEEFDKDWYIGNENNPDWERGIEQQKPNLFSLEFVATDGIYRSRTLSRQECIAPVGSLNSELVRAQWTNLNLELLYMTNDDDERHSIQAQPTTLRNLTVQAADPPLGYPIYSSPPISVPRI